MSVPLLHLSEYLSTLTIVVHRLYIRVGWLIVFLPWELTKLLLKHFCPCEAHNPVKQTFLPFVLGCTLRMHRCLCFSGLSLAIGIYGRHGGWRQGIVLFYGTPLLKWHTWNISGLWSPYYRWKRHHLTRGFQNQHTDIVDQMLSYCWRLFCALLVAYLNQQDSNRICFKVVTKENCL